MVLAGTLWFAPSDRYFGPSSQPINSLAIIPIVNESGNTDLDYLTDGLTESLINNLSQVGGLKVKARSSVFRYKGQQIPPREIGKELNVQAILTGRLVQKENHITLFVSLIEPVGEYQIWGRSYERDLSTLASLDGQIARDLSRELGTNLSPAEEARLAKNSTENTEAFKLYQKGRFNWNKRTAESLRNAIEYFNQALQHDPNFALAYAGLADCYVLSPAYDGLLPPLEAYPKAKTMAQKALSIDESLTEAHTTLGKLLHTYDFDLYKAEREYNRAIELNPNYPTARQWYSTLLSAMNRHDEAIRESRFAWEELEPFSHHAAWDVGAKLYLAKRFDEAIGQFEALVHEDSTNYSYRYGLALAYEQKGRYDEAIENFRLAIDRSPDIRPHYLASLAHTYALIGNRANALKIVQQLKGLIKTRFVNYWLIAVIYVGLGEDDEAVRWIQRAQKQREPYFSPNVDPRFARLRGDPRFQQVMREMGLSLPPT